MIVMMRGRCPKDVAKSFMDRSVVTDGYAQGEGAPALIDMGDGRYCWCVVFEHETTAAADGLVDWKAELIRDDAAAADYPHIMPWPLAPQSEVA